MVSITEIQPVKEFWIASDLYADPCSWNESYKHQIYKYTDNAVYHKRNEPVNGSVAWPLCVLVSPSESWNSILHHVFILLMRDPYLSL
jgi:hypothetical protein